MNFFPFFSFGYLRQLRSQERFCRHFSILFLVSYIVFGCLVVAGCTSYAGRGLFVTKLTYTATSETLQNSKAVSELTASIGYFASCIQVSTSASTGNTYCSNNETQVLLSDDNHFDQSISTNADLFNFFNGTGRRFRRECMDPYAIIISVVLSFMCVCCFAFIAPRDAPFLYKYAAGFSYFSFILALVALIWLETNVTTANELLNRMADQYYTLQAERGLATRGLLWCGVTLQFLASLVLMVLGMLGNQIEDFEEELGIDDKI